MRPVILLTDFGTTDDHAGVCHGVLALRCPGVQVIHLTHGITPQDVLGGAMVLRNTLRYQPVGVHMAVVDPGVGTPRAALAVEATDGRLFVGPDNGLLTPALDSVGGAVRAVSIEHPDVILAPTSATFHGRDIFAPAAAHLAAGGDLVDLGPEVDPAALTRLELPTAVMGDTLIEAPITHIDRFGNIALHLDEPTFEQVFAGSERVELSVRTDRYFANIARTFGNVRPGAILVYVDPYGYMSIAVNQGDAAAMFRVATGDLVTLTPFDAAAAGVHAGAAVAMTPRSR